MEWHWHTSAINSPLVTPLPTYSSQPPTTITPLTLNRKTTTIKELTIAKVTPTKTAQLVKYWINGLSREKEAYILSLEPTPYNLLPYKAKLLIALQQIEEQKELNLRYHISFNNLVCSHAKTRRQQYSERSKQLVSTPRTLANYLTQTSPSLASESFRSHPILDYS
ncbi:hypothetical protein PCANC_28499 [Puccinia coronata f. sp. avenae]|uniref:Uncharacterized protein n=1 Tax=Puccinia coronata f. sp. avenae TaxID=200324 RepID=A0A2N5TH14_9BASI|nr:hypothetical protein PCANC_28499 [Puccinia coronata f. sp. avenae]